LLRLAPANVQQKYASMSKILQSAYRVSKGNALHPDSNPAAYTDAMKQWSIWVVEQNPSGVFAQWNPAIRCP